MTTFHTDTMFLRRALQANGIFSGISGLAMILAASPIAAILGVSTSSILIGIGISLLFYAVGLFRNATRDTINQMEAYLAVILDGAWVIGSIILIFLGLLSTTGNWIVAIVADLVLIFGVLQFVGLRKLNK